MAAPKQLKVPASVAELLQDPQRVADAFTLLNLILAGRVVLTPPTDTKGSSTLSVSGQNLLIPAPIKFTAAIADATASTASNTATINRVLAQLRLSGINPS